MRISGQNLQKSSCVQICFVDFSVRELQHLASRKSGGRSRGVAAACQRMDTWISCRPTRFASTVSVLGALATAALRVRARRWGACGGKMVRRARMSSRGVWAIVGINCVADAFIQATRNACCWTHAALARLLRVLLPPSLLVARSRCWADA